MRQFLKTKFLGIPLLAYAVQAMVIVGIVLAATVLIVPSHVRIVEPPPAATYDIVAYSDAGCTILLAAIEWGDVIKGATATKTVYIKNVGTGNASVSATTTGLNPKVVLTGGPVVVNAGASQPFVLSLAVAGNATLGDVNFDTTFTSAGIP